jgi:DNA-binding LytR/AlgR family response regulator
MKCIIVDDEPIARKGVKKLVEEIPALELPGCLNSAKAAAVFMNENPVDLVFLDIQMPGVNGLEFAGSIPKTTLVVFITAFTEYAPDSYEVDAVSYLVSVYKVQIIFNQTFIYDKE